MERIVQSLLQRWFSWCDDDNGLRICGAVWSQNLQRKLWQGTEAVEFRKAICSISNCEILQSSDYEASKYSSLGCAAFICSCYIKKVFQILNIVRLIDPYFYSTVSDFS